MYKLSVIRIWEKQEFPRLTHHHKPYPPMCSDQPLWGQDALVPLPVTAPQTTRRRTLCGESNFSPSFLVSLGTKRSAVSLFDFFEFCRRVLELCLLEAWETKGTLIVQASWSGPIWNKVQSCSRERACLLLSHVRRPNPSASQWIPCANFPTSDAPAVNALRMEQWHKGRFQLQLCVWRDGRYWTDCAHGEKHP